MTALLSRAALSPLPAILVGGCAAGVLDIVYAFVWAAMRGTTP